MPPARRDRPGRDRGARADGPFAIAACGLLAAASLAAGETVGALACGLHGTGAVPPLDGEAALQRLSEAVVDGRPVGPDRPLREADDHLRQLDGGLQRRPPPMRGG